MKRQKRRNGSRASDSAQATLRLSGLPRWGDAGVAGSGNAFIAGERTIFNAVGNVDANVDFSRLGNDAVVLGTNGAITVTLPSPTYAKPVVDPVRSHVAARDRGLVDRIAGVFSDDPTSERDLYVLAGHKIGAAARESRLLARAEANTTTMLEGLLGKAGFTDVRVVFTPPAPSAKVATK